MEGGYKKKEKYTSYIRGWKQRIRARKLREDKLFALAQEEVEVMADLLVGKYCVQKVLLFGSGLSRETFGETSDLDLAVKGLSPARYFQALCDLEDISSFELDLIQLEYCSPNLKRVILGEGRTIYDGSRNEKPPDPESADQKRTRRTGTGERRGQ